jgi:hypothetical protein
MEEGGTQARTPKESAIREQAEEQMGMGDS